jgi:cation:H+ antiporter
MLISFVLILVSLVLLYFGAEALVKGSSSLALKLGISPLIIGLTILGFGTSSPELLVSVNASLNGSSDIALGNVIGSNIFNICFILGLSAVLCPMLVRAQILKVDSPISVLLGFSLFYLLQDRVISRIEGIVLFSIIVLYVLLNVYLAKIEKNKLIDREFEEGIGKPEKSYFIDFVYITIGLSVLVFGSDLLVDNSVSIAKLFGVSEAIIGLTIVAAGTSTPELATSVVAALKKESDLAIGNIIGSNIYNIAAILGLSAIITPIEAVDVNFIDYAVMAGVGLVLQIFLMTKLTLERWEGAVFLVIFSVYMFWLWPK